MILARIMTVNVVFTAKVHAPQAMETLSALASMAF